MAVFDPEPVLGLLKLLQPFSEQSSFEANWRKEVKARVKSWKCDADLDASDPPQLVWSAHVVQYVNYIHEVTTSTKNKSGRFLKKEVPFYGPRFVPPTFRDSTKRGLGQSIDPSIAYIKPLTVIHPTYFPELCQCPNDPSHTPQWDGWTSSGCREVHGLFREELALSYQLRCSKCPTHAEDGSKLQRCWAMSSREYWKARNIEYWELPPEIPIFFRKSALTRELFDYIAEVRLTSTSSGIEENINQFHLLEYNRRKLEYLNVVKERLKKDGPGQQTTLHGRVNAIKPFSEPYDKKGYADSSISNDLVTEAYLAFSVQTRAGESAAYLRTLTGECISFDHTFKLAKKAKVVDANGLRVSVMGGGLFTVINERNEILLWIFCQTMAGAEFGKALEGLKRRYEEMGVPLPLLCIVDNCCTVEAIIKKYFAEILVRLDVHHFVMRYLAVILNGLKNPYRSAVGQDISSAVLETHAENGKPAVYHPRDEQVQRLKSAYQRWSDKGGVWSAAAPRTHAEQLAHVEKGCLSRPRNDIRSDGSRIEGSHKGWNSLMRAAPSGLEVLVAMSGDHVLRRNIRVITRSKEFTPTAFIQSTYGSHHISLVNKIAETWNDILDKHGKKVLQGKHLPVLQQVDSGESFGIVPAEHVATFGGLLDIKEEPEDDLEMVLLAERTAEEQDEIYQQLGVNSQELSIPESDVTSTGNVITGLQPLKLRAAEDEPIDLTADSEMSLDPPSVPAPAEIDLDGALTVKLITSPLSIPVEHSGPHNSSPTVGREELEVTVVLPLGTEQEGRNVGSKRRLEEDTVPVEAGQPLHGPSGSVKRPCTESERERVSEGEGSRQALTKSKSTAVDRFRERFGMQASRPSCDSASTSLGEISNTIPSSLPLRQAKLEELASQLPLPQNTQELTRSAALFARLSRIDLRSLRIDRPGTEEWHLFLRLRAQHQWASFQMKAQDYVIATDTFNTELKALCARTAATFIKKNPRAILKQLGDMEDHITWRIATKNFEAKTTGNTEFWLRHCFAVDLGKHTLERPAASDAGQKQAKSRQAAVCKRCKKIMYPDGKKGKNNHRKGVCSDGFPQQLKPVKLEDGVTANVLPAPWPQPPGIFVDGTKFDAIVFLRTLRQVYETVVVASVPSNSAQLEYEAFAQLLEQRIVTEGDRVLFRTFPQFTVMGGNIAAPFMELHGGENCVRLDCLRDST